MIEDRIDALCVFAGPNRDANESRALAASPITTLCAEKNTHSRFLLYLRGKCVDSYKFFRVRLRKLAHYIEVKVKYPLLLNIHRKHFIKCLSSTVKPII